MNDITPFLIVIASLGASFTAVRCLPLRFIFPGKDRELTLLREELSLFQQRYKIITENIAACLVVRDRNGTVVFCSPFVMVLAGYSVKEVVGKDEDVLIQRIGKDERARYERALKIAEMGESFQLQHRFLHQSGIELWVESRMVPVFDDSGEITGTLTIMLDVTASVRVQKQIENQSEELRDLSYMISHDLKAPLATIKGMVRILDGELDDKKDEAKEAIRHISSAIRTMDQLIKSILGYFKLASDDLVLEEINLQEVSQAVNSEMAGLVNEVQGRLEISFPPHLVVSDRVKLQQIISNLVGNGLKYHRQGTSPEVSAVILVPDSQDGFELTVTDNGLGIPEEKLSDIFRPFIRLKHSAAEGSGIGLSTVKKLTEKLGGNIQVRSEVGSGTTFIVRFPKVIGSYNKH